jgi:[ribosomal protein S5]-alanine N-acetyltransferase
MLNKSFRYRGIETQRLCLKVLTLEHTEEVFQLFSDENITRYMDIEPCKSLTEAEEIITYHLEDAGCRWGIFTKETEEFIGTCGFHYIRNHGEFIGEVGFDLSKMHWGNGFMSEAMKSLLEYGFNAMSLETIDATVNPRNEKSIALMNRLGFKRDAVLREKLIYFYLTKDNWSQNQNSLL